MVLVTSNPGIKWLMNEGMNELPPAAFQFPNIYNRCPSVSFRNTNHTITITGGNDLFCCWSRVPRKPQLSFPRCHVCLGCCLATALYVQFGDFSICVTFHFYIISNIGKNERIVQKFLYSFYLNSSFLTSYHVCFCSL